jgi:hypothetical protein
MPRLDTAERQLETAYAELWRAEYAAALGERRASSQRVRSRIREIVTAPALLHELRMAPSGDPVIERRRHLMHGEAELSAIAGDPRLGRLVESVARADLDQRYLVDSHWLTRAELNNMLARSPERALRRKCWGARGQLAPIIGSRIQHAIRLRNQLAAQLSGRTFVDTALARQGLSRTTLAQWFEQIRSASEVEYVRLLDRIRQQLQVDTVEPWDLEYYFHILAGAFEEKRFAPEQATSKINGLMLSLGYDLARMPVDTKIADITFGGATYPIFYGREVKILVNRFEGIRFTDTLLHETGHALHYVFDREPSFLLRTCYSEAFDEGLGQVTALMLYRPEIATKYFGLTAAEAEALRERYRLKSLFDIREYMADSLFELSAYDNPDQDLAALYNRIYSRYVGVDGRDEPVWSFEPFYASDPIYLQNYVLAEAVARQVHASLGSRFGSRWDEEAGDFLRTQLFSRGARLTIDQILLEATGRGLSPDALISSFRKTSGPEE